MDKEKRIDYLIKFSGTFLTLITIIIGIYQFNKGQRINKEQEIEQAKKEAASRNYQLNMQVLSKFKESQQKVYSETMAVIGYLANNTEDAGTPRYKDSMNRFYQLYWVELSPVESPGVESALVVFKNDIDNLLRDDFKDIAKKKFTLQINANKVAEAISMSLRDWKLPEG